MDPRATQRGRILELLSATRGAWVPLPKIAACAGAYQGIEWQKDMGEPDPAAGNGNRTAPLKQQAGNTSPV